MFNTLHRLIYCSRNAIRGDGDAIEQEIQNILAYSRRNNHRLGATGALLFTQGCFVQALEGNREMLEDLFERLQGDERHHDVTILSFERIEERAFADWDMAYLGDVEPGASATIAALTLTEAFRRREAKGENILRLMRGVAAREKTWAGS